MRLALALAAALTAAAMPAFAADNTVRFTPRTEDGYVLPPHATDMIDLRIDAVGAADTPDQCALRGKVARVYRGLHYRRGETVVIDVSCGSAQVAPLQLSTFSRFWMDRDWLKTVKLAVVGLDDKGRVVSFADSNGLQRIY